MAKIELPPHTYRRNSRGLIEAVCNETGRVLAVQATEVDILAGRVDRVTRIDTPEGPVFIDKTLNFDIVGRLREYPYSKLLGDLICERVASGEGLLQACAGLGVPYSVVKKWEREQKEFRAGLAQARLDRAEYLHDELLEVARAKGDTKTEIDTLKWAAEKGNPEAFGHKTKISGDPANPVGFIISTGITREVTEVKTEEIKGKTPILEGKENEQITAEQESVHGVFSDGEKSNEVASNRYEQQTDSKEIEAIRENDKVSSHDSV